MVDVCGQLKVLEGVEGDVPVVHHSKDHGDAAALEGQQLDGSQVGNGAVETARQAQVEVTRHRTQMIQTVINSLKVKD